MNVGIIALIIMVELLILPMALAMMLIIDVMLVDGLHHVIVMGDIMLSK